MISLTENVHLRFVPHSKGTDVLLRDVFWRAAHNGIELASSAGERRQAMAGEPATNTYLIAQPFDRAVELLRKALSRANLKITGELNMSGWIQRQLLIGTAPCLVLLVSPVTSVIEGFATDPCPPALTPLHIVVSARGAQTEIHVLRVLPREDGPLDRVAVAALGRLQTAISQAIEKIGMRASLGA